MASAFSAYAGRQLARYVGAKVGARRYVNKKAAMVRRTRNTTFQKYHPISVTTKTSHEVDFSQLLATSGPAVSLRPREPFMQDISVTTNDPIPFRVGFQRYRLKSVTCHYDTIATERSGEIILYRYFARDYADVPDIRRFRDQSTARVSTVATGNYNARSLGTDSLWAAPNEDLWIASDTAYQNAAYMGRFMPSLHLAATGFDSLISVGKLIVTMTCTWQYIGPTLLDEGRDWNDGTPTATTTSDDTVNS